MSPEHLGVALMTSVLRQGGFTARIVEVATQEHETAIKEIQAYDPHVACFTLMSLNVDLGSNLDAAQRSVAGRDRGLRRWLVLMPVTRS